MRIVICEDNLNEREGLASVIKGWADVRKIDVDILCYSNSEEFWFAWPDIAVDAIFLDIKMKDVSGLELAEKIRKYDKDMLIVFTTNFREYSLQGYNVDALNYLVKPILSSKLISVLDKAYDIFCSRIKDVILVTNDLAQIKLFCGNIYFIKMNSHTAELHTDTEIFLIRKTVKELIQLLPSYFVRCHRSYIVNLYKVDIVYKSFVVLSTKDKLPISRNKSKYVNDAFVRLIGE